MPQYNKILDMMVMIPTKRAVRDWWKDSTTRLCTKNAIECLTIVSVYTPHFYDGEGPPKSRVVSRTKQEQRPYELFHR